MSPYDLEFILEALKDFEKTKFGNRNQHTKLAEFYVATEAEALSQIASTLILIKKAEMNNSTKDATFEIHSAQIGLAMEIVNLLLKKIAKELLSAMELVSARKIESVANLTINNRQFLQIANAGKKQWNDIEAILTAAEYIASDGCSPDIHNQWLNDWVANEKLIPALQDFLKRN